MLPLATNVRTVTAGTRGKFVSDRSKAQVEQAELLKGVVIEKVSLSSPLEILAVITATAAATAAIIKLLPQMIAVKNEWNESRVKRAESNLKVEQIELERKIVKMLSDETGKLSMESYEAAGANHPTKKLVKAAVRSIGQLDEAETKD